MENGQPKIEKGIPIPPMHGKRDSGYATILRAMEPGDSVHFKCNGQAAANAATGVWGAGNYVTRKENDGYRIWRK